MKYKVIFETASVENHFRKPMSRIPQKFQDDIMHAIESLSDNPRRHGVIKIVPPVHLFNLQAYYRIRVSDYRVLYNINDIRKVVSIIDLAKRDEKTYK